MSKMDNLRRSLSPQKLSPMIQIQLVVEYILLTLYCYCRMQMLYSLFFLT